MKVIRVDNYDREDSSDQLVAANLTPYWAERIKAALNATTPATGPDYFVVRADEYELHVYES